MKSEVVAVPTAKEFASILCPCCKDQAAVHFDNGLVLNCEHCRIVFQFAGNLIRRPDAKHCLELPGLFRELHYTKELAQAEKEGDAEAVVEIRKKIAAGRRYEAPAPGLSAEQYQELVKTITDQVKAEMKRQAKGGRKSEDEDHDHE